jgi:hypothetical protein
LNQLPSLAERARRRSASFPDAVPTAKISGLARILSARAKVPSAHADTKWTERRARDLDEVLLAIGPDEDDSGYGRNPFEKRFGYGTSAPTEILLSRFGILIPTSIAAYRHPPHPFERWLYTALDFENALTGELFVLRVLSPNEVDFERLHMLDFDRLNTKRETELLVELTKKEAGEPFDAEIVAEFEQEWRGRTPGPREGWAMRALAEDRFLTAQLEYEHHVTLSHEIVEAVACGLFPRASYRDPDSRMEAMDHVLSWQGQSAEEIKSGNGWPLIDGSRRKRFTHLTNAIAAHRLARMLSYDLEEWRERAVFASALWLHASLDSLKHRWDFVDKICFYRPARQELPTLTSVLTDAGCWYPPLTP